MDAVEYKLKPVRFYTSSRKRKRTLFMTGGVMVKITYKNKGVERH